MNIRLILAIMFLYSISFRMIYALSNAGADPNVTDGKGNTPLHEALIRGLANCGFDLIQVFNLNKQQL